jgi:hypothetical protein
MPKWDLGWVIASSFSFELQLRYAIHMVIELVEIKINQTLEFQKLYYIPDVYVSALLIKVIFSLVLISMETIPL